MSFLPDVTFSGVERRREAIAEARSAGRLGATRLPLSLAGDGSISDTFIGKLEAARVEGLQERAQYQDYSTWLIANMERLDKELNDCAVASADAGDWLKRQYFLKTGCTP